MVEFLRDPAWNGVAGIIAIIALIIAVRKEGGLQSGTQKIVTVLGRSIIGVLILTIGPVVFLFFDLILQNGLATALTLWGQGVEAGFLPSYLWDSFLHFGIFCGSVTALLSSSGKNIQKSIQWAVIALFTTTTLVDFIAYITPSETTPAFSYLVISNFFGSLIAGPLIAVLVRLYDNALAISSNKTTS